MSTVPTADSRIRRPFDYIQSGSAGRCLNDLFRQIQADSVVKTWCQHTSDHQLSVKTDLKFRVTRTGRIRVRRFYWSLQRSTPSGDNEFFARTLVLEPDSAIKWLDFPHDPQLPGALDVLNNDEHKQVLRYVPLRRLTVLQHCASNSYSVIKLKRAGRARDASYRLRQINEPYRQSTHSFSLPIDLGHCQHKRAHHQSYCPGTTFGEQLRRSLSTELVEQLGRRLASFHSLSVSTLPVHPNNAADLTKNVRQLIALWPSAADRILKCHDWILDRGKPEADLTLCHGDLSPDNILVDDDQWSLIDLDLAHLGDPVRDLARLFVQLEANFPFSSNEQSAWPRAILAGYQSVRPNSVSPDALHWHGCRAELENLYVAFRKDIGTARSRMDSLVRAERHAHAIG